MRMLRLLFPDFGKFQAPLIGVEYELQLFESYSVDPCGPNILDTMPRQMEKKKTVLVRVDKASYTHALLSKCQHRLFSHTVSRLGWRSNNH